MSTARARRVERLGIEGLEMIPQFKRIYPRDWMASQLLGVTGADNQGLAGLEFSLDETLAGSDGERRLTKDALGEAIELQEVERTQPGADVSSRSTPRSRTAPRRCWPRSAGSGRPRAPPRS